MTINNVNAELLAALKRLVAAQAPFKAQPGESRMDAAVRYHDERTAACEYGRAIINATTSPQQQGNHGDG